MSDAFTNETRAIRHTSCEAMVRPVRAEMLPIARIGCQAQLKGKCAVSKDCGNLQFYLRTLVRRSFTNDAKVRCKFTITIFQDSDVSQAGTSHDSRIKQFLFSAAVMNMLQCMFLLTHPQPSPSMQYFSPFSTGLSSNNRIFFPFIDPPGKYPGKPQNSTSKIYRIFQFFLLCGLQFYP